MQGDCKVNAKHNDWLALHEYAQQFPLVHCFSVAQLRTALHAIFIPAMLLILFMCGFTNIYLVNGLGIKSQQNGSLLAKLGLPIKTKNT
jgi:hypothetical protein